MRKTDADEDIRHFYNKDPGKSGRESSFCSPEELKLANILNALSPYPSSASLWKQLLRKARWQGRSSLFLLAKKS